MILLEKYKLENYEFIRKALSISKKIQVNWRYLNVDSTELVYKLFRKEKSDFFPTDETFLRFREIKNIVLSPTEL